MPDIARKIALVVLFFVLLGGLIFAIAQFSGDSETPPPTTTRLEDTGNGEQSQSAETPRTNDEGARLPGNTGDQEAPATGTGRDGVQSGSSTNRPTATNGNSQTESTNLPNSGPGEVFGIFVITIIAGSILAYRYQLRRN